MNRQKIAKELVAAARELLSANNGTFKCPECGTKVLEQTGYCVKCKKKVEIKNPKESKTKKGTKIAKGQCPKCDTTVCRMGGLQ